MALNIKNHDVEALARQVAEATGETKTEAIRVALWERRERLALPPQDRVLEEMEINLRNLHRGRTFEPVLKDEWDGLHV